METNSIDYHDYLKNKYLRGRDLYLKYFFYPKIYKEFYKEDQILDLGSGTGEFLLFCSTKKHHAIGIDSNTFLVEHCKKIGLEVYNDDICKISVLENKIFNNAICDNVLEHLTIDEINTFFKNIKKNIKPGGILVIIVPYKKGFQKDPTHKTFIDSNIMDKLLITHSIKLKRKYFHPINFKWIGNILYLNMQVYVVSF